MIVTREGGAVAIRDAQHEHVETKYGQRADHHDARGHVDPVADPSGEDHSHRSRAKIKGELERDARDHDMRGSGIVKTKRFHAPPLGGRVLPPPQTPLRSASSDGWVGGLRAIPDLRRVAPNATIAVLSGFDGSTMARNTLVERLQRVADRHDTTAGAVAVAWTLRNPAVDGAIVGFRRPDQVDPILIAASLELSDDDIDTIERRN